MLGFTAYTISTGAFLYSPTIRSQYAFRHPAAPQPTVRFNDFLFALHGAVLCIITYSQFYTRLWGFKVGATQSTSKPIIAIFWGSILGVVATAFVVVSRGKNGGYDPSGWAWIEVVYAISYIKLIVTVVKYMPQVWMNYKRKSTTGWNIHQILLDFSGGFLSLSQLIIDASFQADWSGITGNPAKFLLSNVSMFFDVIFITQHYVLYRPAGEDKASEDEEQPLIPER
ncbi:hypothetical protein H2201_005297 [Coniosporium apollinis]|uniref:Cystinosin n=2 Tax=Coniosporium TaxID=2810619 RepID=A0ABQ9NTS8_9PEZI|nr:hypothetical protein H2199_004166 [Cladosporium sp. JES 115]KAJ9664305.1 hypothetical protein H2201_005297 [Coniosporium apollinis]